MSNSEGYRDDLGASQARSAELEKELDALKKLKAPDIATRRKHHQMLFIGMCLAVLAVGAWYWYTGYILEEAVSKANLEMEGARGRTDAFRAEYGTLQGVHRQLTREVEQERRILAELRDRSARQESAAPSRPTPRSTVVGSRLSSEDLAQRFAQCSTSQRGDFAYEEGVVVSHSVAFEGSSFYVNPCSFERTTTIRFPSGRELPLVQRSMARDEMMPGVACMVGASLDIIERIQAVWEPVVVGSIVGVTTRDDQVAGIRFTSK